MASPVQDMGAAMACSPQSSTTGPNLLVRGGGANSGTTARSVAGRALAPAGTNRVGGDGVKPRRAQETPPRSVACAGRDDLVREFNIFKKSAAPSRVLFLAGGAWNDLPPAVVEALREGFVAGRPMVEVLVGASPCLFDFVRMVRIDAATAGRIPIAWIDVEGRRFFPRMAAGGSPKIKIDARIDKNSGAAAPSRESLEERWDENQVVSGPGGLERPSWAGLQVLDERDKSYKLLEKIFLAGMRSSAPTTRITSIRRCSNGGASGNSRLRAFQMWVEMTKAARGTANVKYGWYGAPAAGIASVVRHGFGQPNNRSLRPEAQAVGVYIAPPYAPHASASMSDPDHAGERHVVLCRVIMGNAEKVDMGSPWCHPSGDGFDSGVDDPEKPRWYIVWGTHMNTHILPEYVVSFKTSEAAGARVRRDRPVRTSTGMNMSFPQLFAELANSLPSSRVQAAETLFNHLKAGKISRDVFLRSLRSIAGDKLLAAIKRFHNRV